LVSAIVGIPVGRILDRYGPRPVMTGGSPFAVPALVLIALTPNPAVFSIGWFMVGVAMAAVFYQAAFAALTRWCGPRLVCARTTLTLAGGLASTLFAPITNLLLSSHSWRVTYLILAVVLAAATIPRTRCYSLQLGHPPASGRPAGLTHASDTSCAEGAFCSCAADLTRGRFALHAAGLALIPLITGRGLSPTVAVLALLGAGQLLGRLGYGPLSTRTTPATRTRFIPAVAASGRLTFAVIPGPAGRSHRGSGPARRRPRRHHPPAGHPRRRHWGTTAQRHPPCSPCCPSWSGWPPPRLPSAGFPDAR
jgi:MFS family permease